MLPLLGYLVTVGTVLTALLLGLNVILTPQDPIRPTAGATYTTAATTGAGLRSDAPKPVRSTRAPPIAATTATTVTAVARGDHSEPAATPSTEVHPKPAKPARKKQKSRSAQAARKAREAEAAAPQQQQYYDSFAYSPSWNRGPFGF